MKFSTDEIGRLILEYDPADPQPEFFASATAMAATLAHATQSEPVSFPTGLDPVAVTPSSPPTQDDPLPKVDVLLVTWTVAEADTLSRLFTPGIPLSQWFEYRRNVATYIPKVTKPKAPFNGTSQRYHHSLGIYYVAKLVGKTVLCFKAGLHMDHDGPALPLMDLWKQIIDETDPALVITTGTGGGIGANVLLGDVIVASQTVFDCTTQFKNETFKSSSFDTSPLAKAPDALLTPGMLKPNSDKLIPSNMPLHPNGLPLIFYPGSATITQPKIVTTDRFAFDNTTNTEGLQQLGNVCDMGDASLGLFLSTRPHPPKWAAIRNASDPQIDGTLSPAEQSNEAYHIYTRYGAFTSAASVLASWGIICNEFGTPTHHALAATFVQAQPSPHLKLRQKELREKQLDPAHLLLQIAASNGFNAQDVVESEVPAMTLDALRAYLPTINVAPATSSLEYRRISYTDEMNQVRRFILIHVRNDDAEVFLGTYLYSEADLVAKDEFVSS